MKSSMGLYIFRNKQITINVVLFDSIKTTVYTQLIVVSSLNNKKVDIFYNEIYIYIKYVCVSICMNLWAKERFFDWLITLLDWNISKVQMKLFIVHNYTNSFLCFGLPYSYAYIIEVSPVCLRKHIRLWILSNNNRNVQPYTWWKIQEKSLASF
jgi:hypothetical protein